MKKIILGCAVVGSVIAFTACGGGSSSTPVADPTTPIADPTTPVVDSTVFVNSSPNDTQNRIDADKYHQKISDGLQATSQLILQDDGIVALANQIQNTDINSADLLPLMKKYDDAMMEVLSKANTLLIDSINFNTLHGNSANNASKERVLPIVVGLGLLAYSGYNLFKSGADAITKKATSNILNVAASAEGRTRVVKLFQDRGIEISDDASISQIGDKIKTININTLQFIERDAWGDAYAFGDSDAIAVATKNIAEASNAFAKIAVEATVTGATGVTGSVGNLLPNQYVGAAFDIVTTVESIDPLSLVNKHVSTSAISENKTQIPIEPTSMDINEAKVILEKISKFGVGEITVGELEDSANAIVNDIAKKDGDGDENLISVPDYVTTQSYTIQESQKDNPTDPNKASGVLKIYEDYIFDKLDIIITNDDEINHAMMGVIPIDQENIVFTIQPKVLEQSTHLSSEKVSETIDSATYRVTATISGVSGSVTITATPTNASLTTATQTLTENGSVSWNVVVLDKDATIAVSRSDSSTVSTINLKGKIDAPKYIEIYKASTTSVTYVGSLENGSCLESVGEEDFFLMDQEGNLHNGTLDDFAIYEGGITGENIHLTNNWDYTFTGTIYSGSWTGGDCKGEYSGKYATLEEIEIIRKECMTNEYCKSLNEIDELIAYKKTLMSKI